MVSKDNSDIPFPPNLIECSSTITSILNDWRIPWRNALGGEFFTEPKEK